MWCVAFSCCMRTFKVRIRKGRIVEPVDSAEIPEEIEGLLIVPSATPETDWLETAPADNIWAGRDRAKALATFKKNVGALKDVDVEARIAAIYRARAEGSRPLSRP
jgi:hypothetical protein